MSKLFRLNLRDCGKILIQVILGSIAGSVLSTMQSGQPLDFKAIGTGAAIAGLTYLTKNVLTNSNDKFLTGENK